MRPAWACAIWKGFENRGISNATTAASTVRKARITLVDSRPWASSLKRTRFAAAAEAKKACAARCNSERFEQQWTGKGKVAWQETVVHLVGSRRRCFLSTGAGLRDLNRMASGFTQSAVLYAALHASHSPASAQPYRLAQSPQSSKSWLRFAA